MSADPKILKSAHRIDRLSYYEAAELSYFGAKILHPRTLEPLAGLKISVRIKNLYEPERPGTEIMPEGIERQDVVKSVTSNRQIAMLRIHGPGVGYKPGIIGRIGQRLADRGINIYSVLPPRPASTCWWTRRTPGGATASLPKWKAGSSAGSIWKRRSP